MSRRTMRLHRSPRTSSAREGGQPERGAWWGGVGSPGTVGGRLAQWKCLGWRRPYCLQDATHWTLPHGAAMPTATDALTPAALTPAALAHAYIAAPGARRFDALRDLLHPDVEFIGPFVTLHSA